jgi:hypothetical protein
MTLIKIDKFTTSNSSNNLMANAYTNFVILEFLKELLKTYNFVETDYTINVNNNDDSKLVITIRGHNSLVLTSLKLKKIKIMELLQEEIITKIKTKPKIIDLKVIIG